MTGATLGGAACDLSASTFHPGVGELNATISYGGIDSQVEASNGEAVDEPPGKDPTRPPLLPRERRPEMLAALLETSIASPLAEALGALGSVGEGLVIAAVIVLSIIGYWGIARNRRK